MARGVVGPLHRRASHRARRCRCRHSRGGRRLGNNPFDGLTNFRLIAQIYDATDTISTDMLFGADPADRDGLLMCGSLADEPIAPPSLGRDCLGLMIAFMPLLSAAVNAVAADGALAELGVTAATVALPLTLANLGIFNVQRVIWYGAEVQTQARPEGVQGSLLLDLEVALSMDILSLVKIRPDAPLVLRYKAVGILLGNPPGQPKFQFRPVFDASKGYTIDISRPGAIEVAPPLGQILKILGAHVARNNPLLFEIELGCAIDLGVVSIDRARVRLPIDPPLGSSKFLDEAVEEHWGTVCRDAAPPAPVFWSFVQALNGPSAIGRNLHGTA